MMSLSNLARQITGEPFEDELTKMEHTIESDGLPHLLPGMKQEILELTSPDATTPVVPGQFKTAKDALRFILAGNAYFTIRSKKTGTRFTYRVAIPKWAQEQHEKFYYVSVLNGPDNEHNYTYLGNLRGITSNYKRSEKSLVSNDAESVRAFVWVYTRLQSDHLAENVEIWHEGRCGRCGRRLTVPESIERGIGPECAGRMS